MLLVMYPAHSSRGPSLFSKRTADLRQPTHSVRDRSQRVGGRRHRPSTQGRRAIGFDRWPFLFLSPFVLP